MARLPFGASSLLQVPEKASGGRSAASWPRSGLDLKSCSQLKEKRLSQPISAVPPSTLPRLKTCSPDVKFSVDPACNNCLKGTLLLACGVYTLQKHAPLPSDPRQRFFTVLVEKKGERLQGMSPNLVKATRTLQGLNLHSLGSSDKQGEIP